MLEPAFITVFAKPASDLLKACQLHQLSQRHQLQHVQETALTTQNNTAGIKVFMLFPEHVDAAGKLLTSPPCIQSLCSSARLLSQDIPKKAENPTLLLDCLESNYNDGLGYSNVLTWCCTSSPGRQLLAGSALFCLKLSI